MAQYRVNTGSLNEVSEDLLILAGDFRRLSDELESVFSKLPEDFYGFRRQLIRGKESVSEITRHTRGIGMVLYEVADHYTRAERSALNGYNRDLNLLASNQKPVTIPNIRNSSGAVLFERTVLPNWLQAAVLEFEKSQD